MTLDKQLDMAEDHRLAGRYDAAKSGYEGLLVDENKGNVVYAHALRGLAEVHRMLESYRRQKHITSKRLKGTKQFIMTKGVVMQAWALASSIDTKMIPMLLNQILKNPFVILKRPRMIMAEQMPILNWGTCIYQPWIMIMLTPCLTLLKRPIPH